MAGEQGDDGEVAMWLQGALTRRQPPTLRRDLDLTRNQRIEAERTTDKEKDFAESIMLRPKKSSPKQSNRKVAVSLPVSACGRGKV